MPGSMIGISINGREFKFAADADGSTDIGGYENEFQANGDGATGRIIQTAKGWTFSGDASIDDDNGDHEFLQDVANSGKFVPIKSTYSDGTIRGGQGNITGAIEVSSMNGTASLTLKGPGKFQKQ